MKKIMKIICVMSLLFGGMGMLIIGCGKKGPPVAPRYEPTSIATDLQGTIQDDTLTLTWSVPKNGRGITGYIVYRSKTSTAEPECESCPVLFERVMDIPILEKDAEDMEDREMAHTEVIEPGFRYIYKVNPYMEGGRVGKDSNYFVFTHEPDKEPAPE